MVKIKKRNFQKWILFAFLTPAVLFLLFLCFYPIFEIWSMNEADKTDPERVEKFVSIYTSLYR